MGSVHHQSTYYYSISTFCGHNTILCARHKRQEHGVLSVGEHATSSCSLRATSLRRLSATRHLLIPSFETGLSKTPRYFDTLLSGGPGAGAFRGGSQGVALRMPLVLTEPWGCRSTNAAPQLSTWLVDFVAVRQRALEHTPFASARQVYIDHSPRE